MDNVGRGKFLFLQRKEPRSPVSIPAASSVSKGTVFWCVRFHFSIKGTDISDGSWRSRQQFLFCKIRDTWLRNWIKPSTSKFLKRTKLDFLEKKLPELFTQLDYIRYVFTNRNISRQIIDILCKLLQPFCLTCNLHYYSQSLKRWSDV